MLLVTRVFTSPLLIQKTHKHTEPGTASLFLGGSRTYAVMVPHQVGALALTLARENRQDQKFVQKDQLLPA